MSAFVIVEAVVISSILSCLLFVAIDTTIRNVVLTHWKPILLLVCVAAFWRYPFHGSYFHGLEYEDSYVYTVSAQAPVPSTISERVGSAYLTSTCVVGSLDSCQEFETYSGHYIGWPAIIRIAIVLFRYSPELPLYLNIAGSCASVVFIFLLAFAAMGSAVGATAAGFIYASTPVFAVNGIATYAEPISNTCITAVLLLAFRFLSATPATRSGLTLNWVALTSAMFLAVFIKRENALLAIGLLLCIFAIYIGNRMPAGLAVRSKLFWATCSCLIVLMFCVAALRLGTTVLAETREFGSFPFRFQNVQGLMIPFLAACCSPKWYSGTFILVLIGIVHALQRRSVAVAAVCFLVGYWLLYIFHVHGYYQVHGAPVLPYETLRFAMNVMTLYSLLAGLGVALVLRIAPAYVARRNAIALIALLIYSGLCYAATVRLRQRAHDEEYAIRVDPARAALEVARQDGAQPVYIVTLEPLLLQTLGAKEVNVIGLYALNQNLIARLRGEYPTMDLLFVDQSQYANPVSEARYATALLCLDRFTLDPVLVAEHYILRRVSAATK